MKRFKAMCKYKDESGSGFGWVYITASNAYEAEQFLRAQYGKLLITHAMPAD